MAPRSRSMTTSSPRGTRTRFGNTVGGGTVTRASSACTDDTGPGDCRALSITKWWSEGGIIQRPFTGSFSPWFVDYIADILTNQANFPHISVPLVPSNVVVATEAAARTNPSRPYVDVPVALLELGDVTQLLRDSGRSLIRKAAGANIKWEFGLAPIISDARKLVNFSEQVNRRVLEIERLRGKTGLRRTVDVWNGSQTAFRSNEFCQSADLTIRRDFSGTTTVRKWAHVRWKPGHSVIDLAVPDNQRFLARRAVLGLTADLSTAWEAIPWSWLIDWGSNVGTYLKSQRNIIPAILQGVHVMEETRTQWFCDAYNSPPATMSPISFNRISKSRVASFVSPAAHFPFLSGRQVGIMASLSVLRGPR